MKKCIFFSIIVSALALLVVVVRQLTSKDIDALELPEITYKANELFDLKL